MITELIITKNYYNKKSFYIKNLYEMITELIVTKPKKILYKKFITIVYINLVVI